MSARREAARCSCRCLSSTSLCLSSARFCRSSFDVSSAFFRNSCFCSSVSLASVVLDATPGVAFGDRDRSGWSSVGGPLGDGVGDSGGGGPAGAGGFVDLLELGRVFFFISSSTSQIKGSLTSDAFFLSWLVSGVGRAGSDTEVGLSEPPRHHFQ